MFKKGDRVRVVDADPGYEELNGLAGVVFSSTKLRYGPRGARFNYRVDLDPGPYKKRLADRGESVREWGSAMGWTFGPDEIIRETT